MFIRKVISRNSVCFQVGSKDRGRFRLIEHIGCAQKATEIEALRIKAKERLTQLKFKNQLPLLTPDKSDEAELLVWHITGFHLVFGYVYDSIGFPNNLLRDLVVARIVYPKSKLATIRYLNKNLGFSLSKNTVYRFLDTLDKEQLTQIAYQFVANRHHQNLTLIFYDVTTLYFESPTEDELRRKGYSKDHRHDMPQILIGLFVDQEGYPFDFNFFEGKTFEGHTLPRMISYLKEKYIFKQLTVVADAGMLSKDNLDFLDAQEIGYIVGARIKNLPKRLKETITEHNYSKKSILEDDYQDRQLLINYSIKRAKRDKANRERRVKKLEEKLKKKRTVVRKSKYLKMGGKNQVVGIDEKKVIEDSRYDGLKGYITDKDSQLSAKEVIMQYHNLWRVEKAFRMSKSDLQERPVYHSKPRRIKAHLTLCFVSLVVMKEAERILGLKGYSVKKAIELLSRVGRGKVAVGKTILDIKMRLDENTQELIGFFSGH